MVLEVSLREDRMALNMAKAVADSKRLHEMYGVMEVSINVGDKPYQTVTEGLEYCMELSVAANNLTVVAYPSAGSDEEIARFVNGAVLAL